MSEIVGRCTCLCHDPILPEGVDATDVLEAAVAQGCRCLDDHCPALLDQPFPRMPLGDVSTAYVDSYVEPEKGSD